MLAYLARRIGSGVVLGFVVLTMIFLAIRVVPGDPARQLLSAGSESAVVTEEALQKVRERLGLDLPIAEQYRTYVMSALRLDLGESFRDGASVVQVVAIRLPATFELIFAAVAVAAVVGLALGAYAATAGSRMDAVVLGVTSLALSVPVYVIGVLLVLYVALQLGILPPGGYVKFGEDPIEHLRRLALPVVALATPLAAQLTRMARSSIRENLSQDWVRTAKSMGLSSSRVFRRHVLRGAWIPITTLIGLQIGTMLGATVLVERVFNWPGVSSVLIDAIQQRDYPVVQGVVIILSILMIAINIVVDSLYVVIDPRIRRGR